MVVGTIIFFDTEKAEEEEVSWFVFEATKEAEFDLFWMIAELKTKITE